MASCLAMKPTRQRRIQGHIPTSSRLHHIPGWARLLEIEIPPAAGERRLGDRRYAQSTDPHAVLAAVVIMLWHDIGHRERRRQFPSTCSPSSLSRVLRSWVSDPEDKDGALRMAWRAYLRRITKAEWREWLRKLETQSESWRDWDQAGRLAGRVFSPWFGAILAETRERQ